MRNCLRLPATYFIPHVHLSRSISYKHLKHKMFDIITSILGW